MYHEDDYIQLSALQHYLFCPRQCALAYMEMIWDDNQFTMQGNILHERVHRESREKRGDLIISRGLRLVSAQLGLSGQADAVEFHKSQQGCRLPHTRGRWQPFPVEYKRGKPKKNNCDAVQLCAQAICLEEMLGCDIPAGALFYGKARRRKEVEFTPALRGETRQCAAATHNLLRSGLTPPPLADKRCNNCSLQERCMPDTFSKRLSDYYDKLMQGET
ncbi:CRISPR-associated protein Cas4 [candidate division KSB3 bacterium]|uniref:CRISPR-associated exonuclease Cas4 n=1 Tax=candidate division KSB3 bacterium TaxID=2044937 RepID=A0A2G6E289_9BACT|nr:MAG: CRISPR-associated protein Cas4 [candidate division KSB3 bacterium]PIE29953.1 MAG: CRISPR-associated protein Cas4 [candidate division KSB3 bacterium]